MTSHDYDAEYGLAIAQQRYVDSPRLANDALVYLLAARRGEMDPMVAIAYAIKNLTAVATARDALRIEQEAARG